MKFRIGRVVTAKKQLRIIGTIKSRLLRRRIDIFNDEIDELARQLFEGEITIGTWEEDMRAQIRGLHTSAVAIGAGGWDDVTSQQWGRVGPQLRDQYRYLHNFSQWIQENADTVSQAQISARSRLYGLKGGHTAALTNMGPFWEKALPWIPRDGSTDCLNGCHCYWKLTVKSRRRDKTKVVEAVWNLQPAEHCETCVGRDGYTDRIVVPKGVRIPGIIGGF